MILYQDISGVLNYGVPVKITIKTFTILNKQYQCLCLLVLILVVEELLMSMFFSYSFPTYRLILTPLQQTTSEIIVTKGEIAQIVSMFSILFINYSFIYKDIQNICKGVFKVVCCRFVVCGKGLKGDQEDQHYGNKEIFTLNGYMEIKHSFTFFNRIKEQSEILLF